MKSFILVANLFVTFSVFAQFNKCWRELIDARISFTQRQGNQFYFHTVDGSVFTWNSHEPSSPPRKETITEKGDVLTFRSVNFGANRKLAFLYDFDNQRWLSDSNETWPCHNCDRIEWHVGADQIPHLFIHQKNALNGPNGVRILILTPTISTVLLPTQEEFFAYDLQNSFPKIQLVAEGKIAFIQLTSEHYYFWDVRERRAIETRIE